jgi:tRNA threonylcarbamoyladenosine biosynthesis protein TsaE
MTETETVAEIEIALPGLAATAGLARRLASLLHTGDLVGLAGALGSGKTTLARDLIAALSGRDREVPSPTYTLVQTYDCGALTVWHFDLYRIERPADVYELGFEDALADGVTLVEWPERLGALMPADHLMVTLAQGPTADARIARLAGHGAWTERLDRARLGDD